MNTDFSELLRGAGEWASALTLRRAVWEPDTQALVIELYSTSHISDEQQARLEERLRAHFSAIDVCLVMDHPVFEQAVKVKTGEHTGENKRKDAAGEEVLFGKRIARASKTAMDTLREESGRVTIEGRPLSYEVKELPRNPDSLLLFLHITDFTNTMRCRLFLPRRLAKGLTKKLDEAIAGQRRLRLRGDCVYDNFEHALTVKALDVMALESERRADTADEKRVELHLHTKMSAMDALVDVQTAIETAARFGHKALAITDHGVVQAFPDAYKAGEKNNVKILYGVEGYLKNDAVPIPMEQTYVVFDIETTGLKAEQAQIIEIGAVKVQGGAIVDRFSTFVDPGTPIPSNITELTGIQDGMVQGAPRAGEALAAFQAFAGGDYVFVAHNAAFDVGFIRTHGARHELTFDKPYVDTLMLSRYLLFNLKNNKLDTVCAHLGVALDAHHRAIADAEATAEIFLKLCERVRERGLAVMPAVFPEDMEAQGKKGRRAGYHHVVLLAKTEAGMKNLYRLISQSHINFFHNKPQLPKFLVSLFREGLLVGSACEQGEVFRAVLRGADDAALQAAAGFYDYLEIQPVANNAFLVRNGTVSDDEGLRELNRRIVRLGKELDKPVVATGDVHFLAPEDAIFRKILLYQQGFLDADEQPPLYFKTTDEMLREFSYLGDDTAHAVVIEAPNAIADLCGDLKPYPDGTYAPQIDGAEKELETTALHRAHALYGDMLPETVQKRLDRELGSIIDNGFASLYLMAQRLVQKSLQDGYLVGSRGSVGSSLVATMAGITEVNPLPPHYLCGNCKHSEFDVDRDQYACGVDMPEKACPDCGAPLSREGYDIPFEVFLGFHGDKTPDIDLNFSGEYQPVAHKYTEEMFGEGHAFRAGTISGIKAKTAYGYVMKYCEEHHLSPSKHEIERLCAGIGGVKRTTGQHPGGIVIVPKENDILEFTPIQHPADEQQKNVITTHFDFHALDDRLVKLDILGHVDPTALRMMQDITGLDPRAIPLNDPDTLMLYRSENGLEINLSELSGCDVGSLGLPEFGTSFVRQILMDTRPTTIEELVRIAGLSHGTDVWLNNAQDLVRNNVATLSEVICTRDDIMNYLIAHGCDSSASFKIMENVRKGKGLTESMEREMRAHEIPIWFIDSCKKIKYMFPRAHAVAYVMMSFRVAYYKFHHPLAFYAVYFTVRADAFDVRYAMGGGDEVLKNIKRILAKGKEATNIENDLLTILEVVYEMNLRGIELLPVDIYKSDARNFRIEDGGIRAPFSAVASVGATAAQAIAENIKGKKAHTVEDFQAITGANSAVIAALKEAGCFNGMADTNQISMF